MLLSSVFYIYSFVLIFMLFRLILFDLLASVSSFYLRHFLFTSFSSSSFFYLLLASSFSSAVPIIPYWLLQELTTTFSLWVYMLYLFLPAVSRPIFRVCIIPRFLFVCSFSFASSWFLFPSLLLLVSLLFSTYLSIIFFRFLFLLITPTFLHFLFVRGYCWFLSPSIYLLFTAIAIIHLLFSICQSAHFSVSFLLSSCDLSFSSNYSCFPYFSFTFLSLLLLSLFLFSDYSYFCCILFVCPSLSLISLGFVFFTKSASTFAIFHFNGIFHSNYFYPRNFLFTCPFLCLFFYRLPFTPFFPSCTQLHNLLSFTCFFYLPLIPPFLSTILSSFRSTFHKFLSFCPALCFILMASFPFLEHSHARISDNSIAFVYETRRRVLQAFEHS